jgi:large subunit ribosomal protein L4
MQAQLKNIKGEDAGKIELQEKIFGVKPVNSFLHEFVTVYEANQRLGTAHTKTKSEVSGGGKKPWKQKHTGRARAGSIRSPLWRHGGVTFGPRYAGKPRRDMPRQKAKTALAQALAARYADGGIVFVDKLVIDEAKTKSVASVLKSLGAAGRVLIVLDQPDKNLTRAGRNIPGLEIQLAADLNAYIVLRAKKLVVTQPALEKLGARWN